jgi:hypothetical protein
VAAVCRYFYDDEEEDTRTGEEKRSAFEEFRGE